jgi:hypothetical protein
MIYVTYPIFRGLWYGWSMNLIEELSIYYSSLPDESKRWYIETRSNEELGENKLFSWFEAIIWPIAIIAHSDDFKYFKGLIINDKLYKE